MKSITFVAAVFLLSASICFGGWVDKQGNSIPDQPHMKSKGELVAQLILTDKEEETLERWDTPSETVHFSTTDQ